MAGPPERETQPTNTSSETAPVAYASRVLAGRAAELRSIEGFMNGDSQYRRGEERSLIGRKRAELAALQVGVAERIRRLAI